ncbi:MAG: PilZ domain-containing protein [Terriglobales bacterium]
MQTSRSPRYIINRPLTAVVFWDETPIRKVHGRCHVLSERGLGASLADQLYVGEVVRIDMPPMRSLYATVRNTRGTDHGLEFLYLRDGQRQVIRALCAAADEAIPTWEGNRT